MDLLKLFPTLLLDLVSKVVPGCIFLLVFQNRYLPPTDLVLQLLSLQSLPADWQSWYRLFMLILTSYVIGIFIAILANAIDSALVKHHWFKRFASAPETFVFKAEHPKELAEALKSGSAFALFIDHCRSAVLTGNSGFAAMLEKYRTAFRLFVGLSLLFLVLPFGFGSSPWSLALVLAPIAGSLAYFMSKRYLQKSIQLFSLAQSNPAPPAKP